MPELFDALLDRYPRIALGIYAALWLPRLANSSAGLAPNAADDNTLTKAMTTTIRDCAQRPSEIAIRVKAQ